MDGFQIRIELLRLLKYLNASQQSIQKILTFAMNHAAKAEDVWSCIVSQCEKSTLNSKLNVLFLIDSLLTDDSGHSSPAIAAITYGPLAQRDLRTIILDLVVPKENWDAVRLNAGSAQQILNSWKHKRLFHSYLLDEVDAELDSRRKQLRTLPPSESASYGRFSRTEVLRRMEEDRERHKRLRERIWILPPKSYVDSLPPAPSSQSALSSPSSQLRVIGSPKEPGSNYGGVKDLRAVGVARAANNASKANSKRESANTAGGTARKRRKGDEDPLSSLIQSPTEDSHEKSPSFNEEETEETAAAAAAAAAARAPEEVANEETQRPSSSSTVFMSNGTDALDVEFEEAWETTSDLNEDDLENILEDEMRWWGGEEGIKNSLKEKEIQDEEVRRTLEFGSSGDQQAVANESGISFELSTVVPSTQDEQMTLLQQEQQSLADTGNFGENRPQYHLQPQSLLSQEERVQTHVQAHPQHLAPHPAIAQQAQVPSTQYIPSGPSGYGSSQSNAYFRGRGGAVGRPSQRGGYHHNNQSSSLSQNFNSNLPTFKSQPPVATTGVNQSLGSAGRGGAIRPIGIMNRGSAHVGRGRGRGWR